MLGAALSLLLSACPSAGHAIIVETSAHRLQLCANGTVEHEYPVAIGLNGVAPKRVGWAQTPLGRFTLGSPRPSTQFHTFVPLLNPDPKRFSAWAIGLHGPPRDSKDAGASNVAQDWTWGCIAVASDLDIDEIARWVVAAKVRTVEFR